MKYNGTKCINSLFELTNSIRLAISVHAAYNFLLSFPSENRGVWTILGNMDSKEMDHMIKG